jgi:diguanylate cyclase (GGDEF)-like protein
MRRPHLRLGIKARLGLVALAPALVVVAGAGLFAFSKAATRREVAELRTQVLHFEQELLLRSALDSEQASAQVLARLPAFGLSSNFAGTLLGRDLRGDYDARRARVDRLLASDISPELRRTVGPLIVAARDELRAARPDVATLADRYGEAVARTRHEVIAELTELLQRVAGVGYGTAVLRAAELAHQASIVSETGVAQSAAIASAVFADEADRDANLATLMAIHTSFDVASAYVLASGTSAGDALRALLAKPTVVENLDRIVRLADAGDARAVPSTNTPLELVPIFRGTFDFDDGLYLVTERAGHDLVTAIDVVARDAHDQLVSALALAAVVLSGTLLIAGLSAASLARPLRRLADDVRAVQLGDLDRAVALGSAATEIGVLQGAVADLVANLRVVDLQAEALADGRLDDPVLSERVPGKLGTALQHSVARLQDAITDERALRERLAHEASHDALTGLLNRSGVLEHAGHVLATAARGGRGTALLFVDLDDFKRVNDTHGHASGDEVLREISTRLCTAVRAGDAVGRLGGDEFVVVMPDVDEPGPAAGMGERLIEALRAPIVVDGDRCVVGASIGVALAVDGGLDALALLEHADVAVFRAKSRGKGRVEVFDAALQRLIEERADLERALPRPPLRPCGGGRPGGMMVRMITRTVLRSILVVP